MSVLGWTRDRLVHTRDPVHCACCAKVISEGQTMIAEDPPGRRFCCSWECVHAAVKGLPAPTPKPTEAPKRKQGDLWR